MFFLTRHWLLFCVTSSIRKTLAPTQSIEKHLYHLFFRICILKYLQCKLGNVFYKGIRDVWFIKAKVTSHIFSNSSLKAHNFNGNLICITNLCREVSGLCISYKLKKGLLKTLFQTEETLINSFPFYNYILCVKHLDVVQQAQIHTCENSVVKGGCGKSFELLYFMPYLIFKHVFFLVSFL